MGGHRRPLLVAAGAFSLVGIVAIGGIATARDRTSLRAALAGTNELPPTDPDGTGHAKITIDEAAGEVCFTVHINDVGTPNRGHIHIGTAEQNGGIVVPLFELIGMAADARNDELEEGRLEDCVPAAPALLAEIRANPAGYYVNLHNARFPGGAARGQLD